MRRPERRPAPKTAPMKSIRLSLIVYFLLLLAVALGTASVLVFRTAADSLREKQETNRQLLRKQYDELKEKEIEKFNEELLRLATVVAQSVVTQYEYERLQLVKALPLGLMNPINAHA